MIRSNQCDNCGRTIINNEKVTVVIPNIEVTNRLKQPDSVRLKLSPKAIQLRAVRIYCSNCVDIEQHIDGD